MRITRFFFYKKLYKYIQDEIGQKIKNNAKNIAIMKFFNFK